MPEGGQVPEELDEAPTVRMFDKAVYPLRALGGGGQHRRADKGGSRGRFDGFQLSLALLVSVVPMARPSSRDQSMQARGLRLDHQEKEATIAS